MGVGDVHEKDDDRVEHCTHCGSTNMIVRPWGDVEPYCDSCKEPFVVVDEADAHDDLRDTPSDHDTLMRKNIADVKSG